MIASAGNARRLSQWSCGARGVASAGDVDVDVVGPETLSFRDFVTSVGRACGVRRGLEEEKLISHAAPRGRESVTDWLLARVKGARGAATRP